MGRKVSNAHRRHTLRRLRGGYYSFDGAVAPGAMGWSRGNEVPVGGPTGGRRRRRKGRKTRKMKGGGSFGAVTASYQGTGVRGIANYQPVDMKGPYVNGPAAKGAFNDFGAKPL